MLTQRTYLLSLAILLFASVSAVALFNWLMNPYGFFQPPTFPEINTEQNYGNKMRLRKAIQIYQQKPHTLIIGSSRSGRGFRCDYLGTTPSCYNASIQGITSYEAFRTLEHAAASGNLREVLWELNFHGFVSDADYQPGFVEELYASAARGFDFTYHKTVLHYYLYALFSPETVDASLQSLHFQNKAFGWFSADTVSIGVDGSWGAKPVEQARNDPAWYHEKKTKGWNFSLQRYAKQLDTLKNTFSANPDMLQNRMVYFETALDFIYRNNINLTILLTTGHISHTKLLWEKNLAENTADWKKMIVLLNDRVARKYARAPCRIVDFSDVNPYTTEADWNDIPSAQAMQWFADPTHFNENLGRKMIMATQTKPVADNWYNDLTVSNIDQHLERLRHQNAAYFRQPPLPTSL